MNFEKNKTKKVLYKKFKSHKRSTKFFKKYQIFFNYKKGKKLNMKRKYKHLEKKTSISKRDKTSKDIKKQSQILKIIKNQFFFWKF